MGLLNYLFVFLVDSTLFWGIWAMLSAHLIWVALLTAIILAIFNAVYLIPKAFAYRYLFSGILCFFLFMVLPIFFTVYIGFTNWGTGHMLSKTQVEQLLLSEKYLPEDAPVFSFSLWRDGKQEYLKIENSYFPLEQESGEIIPVQLFAPPQQKLSKKYIAARYDHLKKLSFRYDPLKLQLYGLTRVAPLQNRYEKITNGIMDLTTHEKYYVDSKKGFFRSTSTKLLPGFSVTVGFDNFTKLFKDPNLSRPFFKIFTWTFVWAFLTVAFTFSLGMLLALMLNRKTMHLRVIYRILLIIPYSIPFFISVLVFKGMYNKDFGVINEILNYLFHIKIDWLNDAMWAKVSCLLVNLWLGFPYMLLLLTGILQSIPGDIYEAARIDGASRWIQFRKITLPLVFSSIGPLLVGSFAFNFNNFVGIYLLTGGNPPMKGVMTPAGETDILISYTYRLAFEGGQGQDFGLASAMAILIFVVIAILTLINFRMSGVIGPKKRKAT